MAAWLRLLSTVYIPTCLTKPEPVLDWGHALLLQLERLVDMSSDLFSLEHYFFGGLSKDCTFAEKLRKPIRTAQGG